MTHSPAHADIGPSAPSKVELIRRARKIREYADLVATRAGQGDIGHALKWLESIRKQATLSDTDPE